MPANLFGSFHIHHIFPTAKVNALAEAFPELFGPTGAFSSQMAELKIRVPFEPSVAAVLSSLYDSGVRMFSNVGIPFDTC